MPEVDQGDITQYQRNTYKKKNENSFTKSFFLESASLIGLLLYSIWSRLWLSLKALVV
jgi:hypothetical protein